jgi:hypothetical protein
VAADVRKKPSEFACIPGSRRDFFGFLNTLAQLLLKALKLTEQTIFTANQKAPHQSAGVEKNHKTLTREQPNETYVQRPDAGRVPAGRWAGRGW